MRKKQEIQLRYYELPEHEPVLALVGDEWKRKYINLIHFHNLTEIGICHWGEGEMHLNEKIVPYGEGTVTMIPPNFPHTTVSRDDSESFWEYLFLDTGAILKRAFPEEPFLVRSVSDVLSREAMCLNAEEGRETAELIQCILREYAAQHTEEREEVYHLGFVTGLSASLLLLFARHEGGRREEEPVEQGELCHILPAVEYIDECYMNPIKIQELAVKCSLSEAHLRRKFEEYLKMSPVEYLTMIRVRKGCELLNTTSYPVTEVALRVGYPTVSTFNRNFQRLVGMSPYQYKKKNHSFRGQISEYRVSAKKGWMNRDDP